MAAEITQIDIQNITTQTYDGQDTNLLSSFDVNTTLSTGSYIEYFVYDNNQNLLSEVYNFSQYTIQNDGQSAGNGGEVSKIILDPEQALTDIGFDQGEYITYFNFLNKQIGTSLQSLYITEISSDRTEIRLDSTSLTNIDIIEQTNKFIQERNESDYFLDFYLNFGENQLIIANNIELDVLDPNNPTILIKLYDVLPDQFDLNSTLWVVTSVEEPRAYRVTFEETPIVIKDTTELKGPNFNLDLKDQVNNSTVELSYIDLITTSLTSSQNQLNSLLEEKELDINIDYTDFNNFIHFSSVQTRLENFYYKIQLIEQYSSSIAILNNTTNSSSSISSSATIYESKIDSIITNFDGYEYYLYYETGSTAWPKTNNQKPYTLEKSDSPTVLTWLGSANETNSYYGGLLLSASVYDNDNINNLYFTIPEYLREDPNNEQYLLFIDMVGQHYDNIWIYYKDVTQKYNADNRLEYGISKDIIADAIRDFGIKLYQNNFSNQDLYTAFLGITPEGGLFPFPNITETLPAPSGFEYIDTLISASSDYIPLDDVNKSLYKRIYHNLPYLLKTKGTLPGLRALITSYGVPDTILRINEFGGKDKINSNDWDLWQQEFNYAFNTEGINFISSSFEIHPDWNSTNSLPSTIKFRFKAEKFSPTNLSQSILYLNSGGELTLQYTGSGFLSGSYSGSIIDPEYQYANLTFYPSSSDLTLSASIYLPFFNEGWWSVMLTSGSNGFGLFAGNNIYEGGENHTELGFYNSSSIISPYDSWGNSNLIYFSSGSLYNKFSGSLQEIRYYNTPISESVFKDYIMNPYSIEGNSLNSGPNELVFRASLGGELYTGSVSIHPKITGSWLPTQSFTSDSNFNFNYTPTFAPNTEFFFADQPVAGVKNIISDKIRIENNVIPEGNTLSPFTSLSQMANISQSYTPNINYLEVAFSPQNEINEDIMSQIGYFNIGEYIGDPRLRSSSAESYPALDQLRNEYFTKYVKNYNLTDFIRLIKFFDNSLFKMIKDFVPARTSLASGVVIKQHLLERNKYPQPQIVWEDLDISGTLKPTWNGYETGTVEHFEGGTGGSFERFNLLTNTSQSWTENVNTPSGSVLIIHNSQDEFYNGELSGSNITVTTQVLNEAYPINSSIFNYKQIRYYAFVLGGTLSNYYSNQDLWEDVYLNSQTSPNNGEILFFEKIVGSDILGPFFAPKYLKISKFDCNGNDNSVALDQINQVLINTGLVRFPVPASPPYTMEFSYFQHSVRQLNEYSTYYLYEVTYFDIPNYSYDYYLLPNFGQFSTPPFTYMTNEVLDYYVSSSITSSYSVGNGSPKIILGWDTISGNSLSYFDTSSGIFTFENTPNTQLIFSASITSSGIGFSSGTSQPISLIQNRNNIETVIASQYYGTLGVTNILLTASIYPVQNDQYYIQLIKPGIGGNINITSAQLSLTQSRTPQTSSCEFTFFEPYITIPNLYNSDENALLNSVDGLRDSSTYQDVDYSSGVTPVNFNFLISGSATKAKVQDSNYTTGRHIIPRYLGSKSISQKLNTWTLGDIGTYGKIPTIESLKTTVAYAPTIGGWPPERMNASAIFIKYLIDQNGNISLPNTSENSLTNTQQTFQTGERIKISTQTQNGGDSSEYRTIIRGGARIEPILYTQIGYSPASFTSSIDLTTDFITNTAVGNYQANAVPTTTFVSITDNDYSGVDMNNVISLGPQANWTANAYVVNSGSITDNVSLLVKYFVSPLLRAGCFGGQYHFANFNLILKRGGTKTILTSYSKRVTFNGDLGSNYSYPVWSGAYLLAPGTFQTNDQIYIEGGHFTSTYRDDLNPELIINNTKKDYLQVSQIPIPTGTKITSSMWGYPDNTKLYAITGANATLNETYNSDFKQVNISSSGFNPITLPWSLKTGDEFRFEGNENNTFMVKKVYGAGETDNERVSQTGSIEVQFGGTLPSGSINLDHFLIRRYVDDTSQIIIEGLKPNNTTGPYIITPEYVTPLLNKNVDNFITDLTQKGLI